MRRLIGARKTQYDEQLQKGRLRGSPANRGNNLIWLAWQKFQSEVQ